MKFAIEDINTVGSMSVSLVQLNDLKEFDSCHKGEGDKCW